MGMLVRDQGFIVKKRVGPFQFGIRALTVLGRDRTARIEFGKITIL